jgi:hypothetical protein
MDDSEETNLEKRESGEWHVSKRAGRAKRECVESATERDERECTEWEAIEKDNNAETNRVSEEREESESNRDG